MKDQSQSNGSNFGPRLKVATGTSKGMLKAGKDYQKYKANMNICNREHNVSEQRANIAKLANKNPLKDSNVGRSNALVANDSKSEYLQSSKHSCQPTSLSLENNLNPSPMDLKCLPSEAASPLEPKDYPNATSKCPDQSHLLNSSRPPPLKAMAGLVHKEKFVDMSNLNKSMGQSNPYQEEHINVEKDITKISKPIIEESRSTNQSEKEVSTKPNISMVSRPRVANKDNSNKEKERQCEVMAKEKEMMGHAIEGRATFNNHHKQTDAVKAQETPSSSSLVVGKKFVQGVGSNLGDNPSQLFHKNDSRCQRNNAPLMEGSNCARASKHAPPNEYIETNLKLPNRVHPDGVNEEINGGKFRMCKQPLLEEKLETHGIDSGVIQQDQTCRSRKKRRYIEDSEDEEFNGGDQSNMAVEHDGVHLENLAYVMKMKHERCIETNRDDDGGCQNPVGVENDYKGDEQLGIYKSKKKRRRYVDTIEYEDDMCDQDRVCVEDGTNKLTKGATSMDCVDRQHCCCSKPIDAPRWSGIFTIDGKEYSLAGHLSTKSCKKVRTLLLPEVVQVNMVPRLAVWPKIWTAKPTGDNIGLYFFPREMRPDEELDILVKEVMDKDLVLRAVIDDAEMLIFPSVLLPERHQTFQEKYYLWAAFKAKEDKGTVHAEQEEDKEKQHVSSQPDELQSEESHPHQEMIFMQCAKPLENQQLPAISIQEVETCRVQGPTNIHLERDSPEERRLRDSLHQAVCTSASTVVATYATSVANAATIPSESTSFATNTASCPANHGPTDPSMEAHPSSSSSIFGIFVRETPKVKKLIQELERDGALIAFLKGDAIGAGQWPSNVTTATQ